MKVLLICVCVRFQRAPDAPIAPRPEAGLQVPAPGQVCISVKAELYTPAGHSFMEFNYMFSFFCQKEGKLSQLVRPSPPSCGPGFMSA